MSELRTSRSEQGTQFAHLFIFQAGGWGKDKSLRKPC